MRKIRSIVSVALVSAIALTMAVPINAQINYKSIPLDGGGWFSGYAMHSSGRLYGYGDVFGAWRSDDAGKTWSYLNRNITSRDNEVSGIAVAAGNANRVAFRATKKLFLSNDGGKNWNIELSDLNAGLDRGASTVMFHPGDDTDLWLVSKRQNPDKTPILGTLWRSKSGGAWSKVGGTTFDDYEAVTIHVHPKFPDQVWVGARGGLFVSTNRGVSWTHVWGSGITNTLNGVTTPVKVRIVNRKSDGTGYMVTNNGGFRITSSNWNDPATYVFEQSVSNYGGYGPDGGAVVKDANGQEFFLSSRLDGRSISSTGAVGSWQPYAMAFAMPSPPPIWGVTAGSNIPIPTKPSPSEQFVQDPTAPNRWFATNGKAPLISTDYGANWTYVPNGSGVAGVMTYKISFPRDNRNMALIPGADKGAFVVTDGGVSGNAWGASNPSIGKLMTAHEVMSSDDGKIVIAAGTDQNSNKTMIVKSTNYGASGSWTELDLTNSGLPHNGEGVTHSVMTPGNPDDFLVLLGNDDAPRTPGMWRTQNGGKSFTMVNGLPDGMNTGAIYHPENSRLVADGINTSTRYFACRPNLFYRSFDNGQNWSPGTFPVSGHWISDMAVDRYRAGRIWVACGGVRYSNDGGTTWNVIGKNSANVGFIDASLIDAASGRVAVWGKRTGDLWSKLYYSPDDGVTWTEATSEDNRYAFTQEITVDPWVAGKVWVSGISVNVITNIAVSKTPTPTPVATPTPTPVATPTPTPVATPTPTPVATPIPSTVGRITRDVWTGISGNSVSAIPVNTTPTSTGTLTSFEAPSNVGDNYGQRVRGYLTAPTTGNYTFWIAGDDSCELWLSAIGGPKSKIASVSGWTHSRQWNKFTSQKSMPIPLQAGQQYYIEALMKEFRFGDTLAVGWSKPGQSTTAPSEVIPGSVLSPFATGTPVAIANPGFESGISPWVGGGAVHGVNTAAPRTGSYNSYNNGSYNSIYQSVTVQPNSSYTLKVWGRLATAVAGNNQAIYVNNGGTTLSAWITGTAYTQYTINFTTGANTTSVEIGNYDTGSSAVAYTDDYTLTKN